MPVYSLFTLLKTHESENKTFVWLGFQVPTEFGSTPCWYKQFTDHASMFVDAIEHASTFGQAQTNHSSGSIANGIILHHILAIRKSLQKRRNFSSDRAVELAGDENASEIKWHFRLMIMHSKIMHPETTVLEGEMWNLSPWPSCTKQLRAGLHKHCSHTAVEFNEDNTYADRRAFPIGVDIPSLKGGSYVDRRRPPIDTVLSTQEIRSV